MGTCAGKCKQSYVHCPRDRSKLTCLINGIGNLSFECKVLNHFGAKYANGRDFKEHRQDPTSDKIFGKN